MDRELLKKLCETPGVSGYEEPAQEVMIEALRPCCDELYRDRLGNVIGVKRATRPVTGERPLRVVLAAHVDEYGFMVKEINDQGYVKLSIVSAAYPPELMGHVVVIHGKEEVRGVLAPTWKDVKMRELKIEDLWVDTGRSKEWVEERIQIGDVGTLDIPLTWLNDKTIVSRNFDDRIGSYCMVEAARRIGDLGVDLYFVSSTQEEVGIRGIPVAISEIDPDMGLAIDGGLTKDPYGGPPDKYCELGGGTAVYVLDRLTFGNRKLLEFLYAECEEKQIPYQKNYGGGTDASAIQRIGSGALTTTIGAPTAYMHTSVQTCNVDDVEATIRLLVAFAENAEKLLPDGKVWETL